MPLQPVPSLPVSLCGLPRLRRLWVVTRGVEGDAVGVEWSQMGGSMRGFIWSLVAAPGCSRRCHLPEHSINWRERAGNVSLSNG